jgi:tetratricopeptide (TPR) repeat protein
MKRLLFDKPKRTILLFLLTVFFTYAQIGNSQNVRIFEEQKTLKTYPFSDPNPIPNVSNGSKIYPYFKFDGYSDEGQKMSWKIIGLENEYIQVFVLPEIGGKVWGAVEKSTGNEFIYKNEVIKFRNIAMRGPWTSGGIELNFGIIGHSPSTASKVDYMYRDNEDGSVSCFVGNLDLPSRTFWRVEVRLMADKAFFETHTMWYNPTSLTQSYYNWMTAAAATSDGLEFFFPGTLYLKHSGEPKLWPVDSEGRNLSFYKNNDFGPSKSYHVAGSLHDFFGGYFHDLEFGFGHWSPYEEMPGQKLWLWALSRSGGIWEDLLTDTDGQYIEFQAGRLFNQYSPGTDENPVRQVGFPPYATDQWKEFWFPFKDIKGMTDATAYGVLNVTKENDVVTIGINALQNLHDTLIVRNNYNIIHKELLQLTPMEVFTQEIQNTQDGEIEVIVGNNKLHYSSNKDSLLLKRPFKQTKDDLLSDRQRLINEGQDAMNFREYEKAIMVFHQVLDLDPSDREALLSLSEIHFRRAEYDKSLDFVSKALIQNTYDGRANYLAGISFQQKDDAVNALESFGWAARSMEYRSAAYAHMAKLYIKMGRYEKANEYVQKSLDFNRYNIPAHELGIIAKRLNKQDNRKHISDLQKTDPLNHLSRYEEFLADRSEENKNNFRKFITNEFPEETYLELALNYHTLGLNKQASDILTMGPGSIKNDLWRSYLNRVADPSLSMELLSNCVDSNADFVFPYRPESIKMLEWARSKQSSWKLDYYLALAYAGLNRMPEASDILMKLEDIPDYWVFYLARVNLVHGFTSTQKERDILKAHSLASENWRSWNAMIQFYLDDSQSDVAATHAKKAYKKFPHNYTLVFLYAKALLEIGEYSQCINILKNIQILPFEGANESRRIYEEAHIRLALELIYKQKYKGSVKVLLDALKWPENIGVGKPYDPEQRKTELLLAYCYEKMGQESQTEKYLNHIVDYTEATIDSSNPDHYLGLLTLKIRGDEDDAITLLNRINNSQNFDKDLKQWINNQYNNEAINLSIQGEEKSEYILLTQIANLFFE